MNSAGRQDHDVIVIGSGAAGGTLARELALRGQRVLVLEKGAGEPDPESKIEPRGRSTMVFIGRGVPVVRGVGVGGTTMLFYNTFWDPPAAYFRSLGIDLGVEVEEARKELPVAVLSDELMGPLATSVMKSARQRGYKWRKLDKVLFQERCRPGELPSRARWNTRYYLREAVEHGAQVLPDAEATRVLLEDGRVRGVEFVTQGERRQALAPRVIVSAGGIGSPQLLQASGLSSIGDGFFCDPLITVCGTAEGEYGAPEIPMAAGVHFEEEGVLMTDLWLPPAMYRLMAITALRVDRVLAHSRTLSIMVKIRDEIAGRVTSKGLRRVFGPSEREKLDSGYRRAREILEGAGARGIFRSRVLAAHPGGTVRIGEHVDANLETEYAGLFVCDCSVIADPWGLPPALTLIALAKRLARHLS